ncbi:hypothetical protein PoB_007582500 [Plakobranchus ocellatus]|uniref:Uncharacterized protein n=1 Tax=Plakobranchus ocellatus TaxID=259542 RepID=A0AAV4DZ29_9GAST|nr:hypothetical protein PoB_007582500 [Plakobranchus ocellatus]
MPRTPEIKGYSKTLGPKLTSTFMVKIDESISEASLLCFSYNASSGVDFDKASDALRAKSPKLKVFIYGVATIILLTIAGCAIFTLRTKPRRPKPSDELGVKASATTIDSTSSSDDDEDDDDDDADDEDEDDDESVASYESESDA